MKEIAEMQLALQFSEWLLEEENYTLNTARNIARKYMLPVTVVAAILTGQGCSSKKQCPTPAIQQQIKIDAQNVRKSRTDDTIGNYHSTQPNLVATPEQTQNTKEVIIKGDRFQAIGRARIARHQAIPAARETEIATKLAQLDAYRKLRKHLQTSNLSVYEAGFRITRNNGKTIEGVLIGSLRASDELKQFNNEMDKPIVSDY